MIVVLCVVYVSNVRECAYGGWGAVGCHFWVKYFLCVLHSFVCVVYVSDVRYCGCVLWMIQLKGRLLKFRHVG